MDISGHIDIFQYYLQYSYEDQPENEQFENVTIRGIQNLLHVLSYVEIRVICVIRALHQDP